MKKLLFVIISLLYFNNLSAQKYIDTYIEDANRVGLEWWSHVNTGQYELAYSKLSNVIKNRATQIDWENQMSILMGEFGSSKNRKVKNTYFQSKLEGYEDGFYVIIEYDVKYTKTRNHNESLLLKQSDEFEWEVFDFDYSFQNLKKEE